ncbi:MAG: hypothetical protein IJY87_04590 [Bacilli bacterium]|nr:hypothetical protein [Bacilli bacterium]
MEIKIVLINAMKYKDKETGLPKVRIGYVPFGKEAFRNEEKFRGFTELGGYTERVEVLEELKDSDFMQEATLVGEEVSSARNPFKKTMKLTKLITKNATISLL